MGILQFADCESGLAHAVLPTWVMDGEGNRLLWSNDAGLEFWNATDRAELHARDFAKGVSEKVRDRVQHSFARARSGTIVREEWTFYPGGKPTTVLLDMRGVAMPDGSFAVLNQALPLSDAMSASVWRGIAMFNHTSIINALVRGQGEIVAQNSAALLAFGESESWLNWFIEPADAIAVLELALTGQRVRKQVRVSVSGEPRSHLVEASLLRDPVSGNGCVFVEHTDETARVEAEDLAEARGQRIDALRATLEIVERQRREILALSAPIIDVGDRTLAVPIVGALDNLQSHELVGKLLDAVTARGARVIILDVTGVADGESLAVAPLLRVVRVLRLIGATARVTGVRPGLALRMLEAGFDLREVATFRSLAEGLRAKAVSPSAG